MEGFEAILKILIDLPPTQGQLLDHLTLQMPRHMLFIPLTQKALVQYCTGALISFLRVSFIYINILQFIDICELLIVFVYFIY